MTTEVFSARFPHSDIFGSRDICSSPKLFAAYHVFLRLLVPRHPPYALFCLTSFSPGYIALYPAGLGCFFFLGLFSYLSIRLGCLDISYLRFIISFSICGFQGTVLHRIWTMTGILAFQVIRRMKMKLRACTRLRERSSRSASYKYGVTEVFYQSFKSSISSISLIFLLNF